MAQLHDLTLLEQAAAVRNREVSPVELVDHYLDRIDRVNETVGAFVYVAPDLARAAAKDAESAVTSRTDPPPSLPGAAATRPLATAAPAPPLDPPAERVRSHGVRAGA